MDNWFDFLLEKTMYIGVGLSCVAVLLFIFVGIPCMIYDHFTATTFELRLDQWTCSNYRTDTTLVAMPSGDGKSTQLVPMAVSTCITYTRVKG
jgi:hypothetical protein